jgi:hypothetical protein
MWANRAVLAYPAARFARAAFAGFAFARAAFAGFAGAAVVVAHFAVGATLVAAAFHVSSGGVATTTTRFAPGGTQSLSGSFLPATVSHDTSTAAIAETAAPTDTPTAGTEPVALAVPALGIFTVSVAPGTVSLAQSASAAALTQRFTVSDTRNGYPGWSVSALTGSGAAAHHTISGNQLGWIPFHAGALTDAELGPPVAPAAPGLETKAASLAVAPAGHGYGTYVLFAELILHIPRSAPAGPYSGTLTITYVEWGP